MFSTRENSKIDIFFDPRSRGVAREHFSKIQIYLISALFVVVLCFWPFDLRGLMRVKNSPTLTFHRTYG